jgi:iron complex outermembrane recepter protein
MRLSRSLARLSASASAIAILASMPVLSPAQAQQQAQAQGLALEEIVVTARKVEENLMTVPIAITAFGEKDIEAMGIKQLNDVMVMTPSFNFVNQQGGSGRNDRSANALVFRGLFLSNNVGLNAGGQLFIDGAPVIGAQPPSIIDVERIEVLKGPQSAYFGRSTFVGAINFVIREPGNEFKGKVSAEASSFGSHDGSISVEGPIIADKLSARVSGRHFVRGGQFVNQANTNEKLGRQSTGSVSGSFVFRPTDDLKIKAYANWFEDNDGPPAQGALKSGEFTGRANADGSCTPFSTLAPGVASPGVAANSRASLGYFCGTLPKVKGPIAALISGDYDLTNATTRNSLFRPNPNWVVFDPQFNQHGGIKRHAFQSDLRIDYSNSSGYSFTGLTAFHRERTQTLIDLNYRDGHDRVNPLFSAATAATRVPWMQFLLLSQNKSSDWSQEVRLTSPQDQALRFTVGGNYLDAHSPGGTVYGQTTSGPLFTAAITQQDVQTPAVFGAAYYDVTEQLTISAEARYQWDKITTTPKVGVTGNPVTGVAANPLKDTFKSFSPRISVDYKYADNSTIYALFSRGYRPGGFNAGLVTANQATLDALRAVVPNAATSFLQEKLDNYEAGIKSTWLDGRARTTLTVYKNTWSNGQVANSVPVTIPGPTPGTTVANLIGLTVNNGKAALKGVEFEGQVQATEGLRLAATFGLNDTEIKTFGLGAGNCSDCNFVYGNFSGAIGRSLPTTPKYTWSASAEYTDELVNGFDWFARADYSHRGSNFTDLSGVAKVGSSDNINARLGVRNDNVTIEAFVTNLTQNRVMKSALLGIDVFTFLVPPNRNEIRFSPADPRTVGIRASYNF